MKTFVVLGMHRSDTSRVSKGLSGENVHLGDDMLEPDVHNPLGYHENHVFRWLNADILKAAGGAWDDPPPTQAILDVAPQFDERIRFTVQRESAARLAAGKTDWGWKDPTTTLTARPYVPHLVNPHFIACFREPRKAAESFAKRNGHSPDKALALAHEYNARLVDFLRWFAQRDA